MPRKARRPTAATTPESLTAPAGRPLSDRPRTAAHRSAARHAGSPDDSVLVTAGHTVLVAGRAATRRLSRRAAWFVVAAAALTVAVVIGVTALVGSGTSGLVAVSTADDGARQLAADRAGRGAPGSRGVLVAPGPAIIGPTTAGRTAAPTPTATPAPAWVNPLPGAALTSCYGARWGTVHQGIDLALAAGTPIRAVGAGTVLGAGWLYAGYGESVMIDHGNGVYSHYAHASKVLVQAGDTVVAGQPIALEGSTGDATGPHLHFEIHIGLWNQVDPAPWLRAHGVAIGC